MIHIFGGGTVNYVRNHFALCAPAFGTTARQLAELLRARNIAYTLHLTRMADSASKLETNDDVERRIDLVLQDPDTSAIVVNVALCDFQGQIDDVESGKYAQRLQTRSGELNMHLIPAKKILAKIKATRPDVVLVGFKTTANEPAQVQIEKMQRQIAETQADIVFGNDTVTRNNIIIAHNHIIAASANRQDMLVSLINSIISSKK